jgi:hypothetical protein
MGVFHKVKEKDLSIFECYFDQYKKIKKIIQYKIRGK